MPEQRRRSSLARAMQDPPKNTPRFSQAPAGRKSCRDRTDDPLMSSWTFSDGFIYLLKIGSWAVAVQRTPRGRADVSQPAPSRRAVTCRLSKRDKLELIARPARTLYAGCAP